MRISDWSSDVCSSDLLPCVARILKRELAEHAFAGLHAHVLRMQADRAQEAHVAQQRIAELADVDLGGATAKTGIQHHLLRVLRPTLDARKAEEQLSELAGRTVRLQALNKYPGHDPLQRRDHHTLLP